MKPSLLHLPALLPAALLGLALVTPSRSCTAGEEAWKPIHVADLVTMQKSAHPPVVLDANQPDFRDQNGVVPGAKLLSNFKRFDLAKELPADKATPLVFYCVNTH